NNLAMHFYLKKNSPPLKVAPEKASSVFKLGNA
ncbi:MAG: hypothetical protein ACI9YB_001767, partial [Halioglobus sp.]